MRGIEPAKPGDGVGNTYIADMYGLATETVVATLSPPRYPIHVRCIHACELSLQTARQHCLCPPPPSGLSLATSPATVSLTLSAHKVFVKMAIRFFSYFDQIKVSNCVDEDIMGDDLR